MLGILRDSERRVRLDGAKGNSDTTWPEGLAVPDTVEMVED